MDVAEKRPAEPSPDKLIRDEARHYRTADGRFEVQAEAAGSWYLSDAQSPDELGLPRLMGPYGTLEDVRIAIQTVRADRMPRPVAARAPADQKDQGLSPSTSNGSSSSEVATAHGP